MVIKSVVNDPNPDPEWRFFEMPTGAWRYAIQLGLENGWVQQGLTLAVSVPGSKEMVLETTMDYEPMDWGGRGVPSRMSASDAAAWADALEASLTKPGTAAGISRSVPTNVYENVPDSAAVAADLIRRPVVSVESMEAFIAFLRKGGFGFAIDD